MQGDPICLYPPDRLYRLRSEPQVPVFTGTVRGGRQWLLVAGRVLEFDTEGRFTTERGSDGEPSYPLPRAWLPANTRNRGGPDEDATWVTELGFEDGPIAVLRFWRPDLGVGISDFPLGCVDLPRDPDLFTAADWEFLRTSEWGRTQNVFTLQLGAGQGELWVDRDGKACLHSK